MSLYNKNNLNNMSKEELFNKIESLKQEVSHLKKDKQKLIEYENRDQNKFLTNVIDSLNHPFYVIDVKNYKIKLANTAAKIGIGITCHKFTHNLDRPCSYSGHICPLDIIKKNGKPVILEHTHFNKKDGKRFYELHAHPVFDVNGRLKEIIEYTLDITDRKQIENSLLESVEHYRNFFENSLVGLIQSRLSDGLILKINAKAAKTFGLPVEEIVGKVYSTDIWKDSDLRKELISRLKKDGEVHGFEAELKLPNRQNVITSISVKAYPEKDYMEGAIIDITAQKKAIEEVENLAGILRQSTDSIVLTNLEGEIEYVNPMFEKITGYTFEEVKGKNPRILQAEDNPYESEYYKNMWDKISNGEIWKGEFLNKKKNGDTYLEEVTIFPFRDIKKGFITGYGAVKKDVTKNREMEEKLKQSYDSVLILKEKAISSNILKSQFLANMSHDIRTPLNAVLGFTDLLSKNENREESQLFLSKIKNAGEGLLNLINDILDLSKIEAGHMNVFFNSFYIKELFNDINDIFEVQFKNKELRFESFCSLKVPEIIYNDRLRIKQVATNLLTNALKFTIKGKVSLYLDYDMKEDVIIIRVEDTGIGIPLKKQDKIFEPFRQIDDENRFSQKGAGLGLAICDKLIQLMGGTISFSSIYKKGTKFTAKIPANSRKVIEKPKLKSNRIQKKPSINSKHENKILIVDDNPVNMELLSEQLKNAGFNNLLTAVNGKDALKLAFENSPELILMDIQMPVMNGNEAITLLKKRNFKGIIFALSAFAMKDEIDKSINAGALEYITKPIDFNLLFNKIGQVLKKKEQIASLSKKNNRRKPAIYQFKIKESVTDRMKNIFIKDLESKIELVTQALKDENFAKGRQQMKIIVHAYQGNAQYFGLNVLANAAIELDQSILDKKPDYEIILMSKLLLKILKNIYKINN